MINHTTELTEAQQQIERLTLDISCMKTSLDAERKENAEGVKMFSSWLDGMIKIETSSPIGFSYAKAYEICKKNFNELVAK